MSSSQSFLLSSPLSATGGSIRKSAFTFKNLSQLALSSTQCPLRVIAHLDLDAFYAQCEVVRLGMPEDQPLAVRQWDGLIAINYAAKSYGLSRHISLAEAKKLCPQLIAQHVATWREGDDKWAYHENAEKHIATHKVSLDPYRLQSRKILAVIKETLPTSLQTVEKAGIDEVFLDLSAHIHKLLLDRYSELRGPPPYDDPTELLPRPHITALDWKADHLVDLDSTQTEDDDPDWDDVAMLIGSEIVRDVRLAIRDQLKYTSSAGIAQNKLLSKLGSAYKKPSRQTVIRNRAIKSFMADIKLTKMRNFGGKLGEEVVSKFNVNTVQDLHEYPMTQLKLKLGEDTGGWVYQQIRGIDNSAVNSRTQIKSMLSAKSFRPSINSFDQGARWLRIFVADIFSRLVEEGVLENKRRPKTMNLHYRHSGQTKSRQTTIPPGKSMSEEGLFELSKTLLSQIISEGNVWPCSNLSLSVAGFEDGITGNLGIGAFLVKGNEAKVLNDQTRSMRDISTPEHADKRRKVGNHGIQKFLFPREHYEGGQEVESEDDPVSPDLGMLDDSTDHSDVGETRHLRAVDSRKGKENLIGDDNLRQSTIDTYFCETCKTSLPLESKAEHEDWHFAMDLQAEDSAAQALTETPRRSDASSKPKQRKRAAKVTTTASKKQGEVPKGQRRLAFG